MRSSSLLNMSIGFAVWLNWRDMDDREGEASVPACQPTDLGSWRGSDDAAWARRFARRRHGSGLSRLPQRSGRALLPLLGIAPGFGGSGSGDVRPGSPHREGFRGDSSTRTWLFSIATRVCLDLLRGRKRRIVPATRWDPSSPSQPLESPPEDIAWLGPLPTVYLLDSSDDPASVYTAGESVRLAFVIRDLPKQASPCDWHRNRRSGSGPRTVRFSESLGALSDGDR